MLRWTVLFAIIALLTAPAVMAQEPIQEPLEQPRAHEGEEMSFTGEIVSVDPDAKSITVREVPLTSETTPPAPGEQPAGKIMTLSVDASTKITSKADTPPTPPPAPGQAAGKTLEVKDLKAGDRVMVKYTASEGKNLAKSIEVTRKATS